MKRLIKKIKLKLFCDDANGEYGVTHVDTYEKYGSSFNAFWGGIGIFHDVWEHYFETEHKYFKGKYAMNVGGEMAAMGHMWYYQMTLGLYSKRRITEFSIYSDGERMRQTTQGLIEESVRYGYTNFGSTLESCVPKQKPIDDGEFEWQLKKFWEDIKVAYCTDADPECRGYAQEYKKSVTFRKIADLHRWGVREAERFVPDTSYNCKVLYDFIDFWNEFCKNNRAEDLYWAFKELHFYIYKEEDVISWKSKLIGRDSQTPDYIIRNAYEFVNF